MDVIPGVLEVPLWALLLLIASVLFYIYATWTYKTWSSQGIKGPYPIPYFGTFLNTLLKGGFYHTDLDLSKRYGKYVGLYVGRLPALGVSDPEFLRKAMVKEFASMPNRLSFNVGGLFNLFLTALKDDHWKHVRSSITPTFTTGKLRQMKPLIDKCSDSLVEHITQTKQQPFDTKTFAGGYTMDVIASTAFGIQVDSQKNPDDPMLVYAREVMGTQRTRSMFQRVKATSRIMVFFFMPLALNRLLKEVFGINIINTEAFRYFTNLANQIFDQRENEESERKDFVQLCKENMVEDPKPGDPDTQVDQFGDRWSTKGLTRNEIIANAILFFLAGFETTATTLNFVMYELAMNPEVQEKAYQEILQHSTSDSPSYEELSKMEYIDRIIDETLRLYPPAGRLDRMLTKEVEIDGIRIPAGGTVTAMVYALHHDPEIYPDPLKFDPERFTPENKASRHQYAYMPFGIGNRNCIAMRLALLELKVALAKVLTNFNLKQCATTVPKPVPFKKGFQLDTATPNELIAEPRE